ncbi:MAG: hypothetical protein D6776_09405 [Planctomycetota bacterium]|nr:MAG: hypothetical protein D6776_09405 [Planctomycetota bacterium]
MDPIAAKGLGGLSNLGSELGKVAGRSTGAPGKFEALRTAKLGQKKIDPVQTARNFLQTGNVEGPQQTTMAQRVAARDGIAFRPVMGLDGAQKAEVWSPNRVQGASGSDRIASAITDLNTGQERLEQIIQELRSGKQFSTQELLGLQAEVNLLSEQIQMSTKLVDSAMQSIKQVMQQQG